jgi:hypothetical protein
MSVKWGPVLGVMTVDGDNEVKMRAVEKGSPRGRFLGRTLHRVFLIDSRFLSWGVLSAQEKAKINVLETRCWLACDTTAH